MRFESAALLCCGVLLVLGHEVAAARASGPQHAPGFSLPAAHGTVTLDSLRGRVVLVDFWASWCEPCRRSFPYMDSLRARLAPRGFEVVAIDLDKDREAAERFLALHPVRFPVAFDPSGATAEVFHVDGMPTSVLIGADGTLLRTHVGFERRKAIEMETAIERALPR